TEFGASYVRNDMGYAHYQKLLEAELPDPGWSTERFVMYHDQDSLSPTLRLPSGLRVYVEQQIKTMPFADPIVHTEDATRGHLYVVRGHGPISLETRETEGYGRHMYLLIGQG